MLKERPQIQDQFFEVLRQKIFSGTSEAKIRALSVFAEIIRNDDDIISETSEVTENLFDKLNSTGKLLNLFLYDMEKVAESFISFSYNCNPFLKLSFNCMNGI